MTTKLPPFIDRRRVALVGRAGVFGIAALALSLVAGAGRADAQLRPWGSSNEVYIDLTVLDGGAPPRRPAPGLAAPGSSSLAIPTSGGLMEPPSRYPRSRLLVSRPPSGAVRSSLLTLPEVKLRRPGRAAKKTRRARRPARARPARTRPAKTQPIRKPPSRPKVVRTAEPMSKKPAKALTPPARAPKAASSPKPAQKQVAQKQVAKTTPAASAAPPRKPDVTPPPAVTAPRPAAKIPAAQPKAQQQAALPKPAPKAAAKPGAVSIAFSSGDAILRDAGKARLNSLAKQLKGQPRVRMQLLAYAGGNELSASKARRLSLSRALAIRSYLIGKGLRSTRIDVRALGNKVPGGQPNRVDLKLIRR